MDIKLFSLCNQDSHEAEAGKKKILECVNRFFPECTGFSEFTSQKRMLVAISRSLLAADIVLVAVQSTMYNTTKRLLAAALNMQCIPCDEIADVLHTGLENKKIKPSVYKANVILPETASLLPTQDYINCGFSLTSGGQHIIYIPVEEEKAKHIIYGSLYDYFAQLSEPHITVNAMKHRHTALISEAVKTLGNDSVKVAVVGNDAADYLTSYLSKKDSSAFTVDMNYEIPTEDKDIKSLAISAARNVRESNHADLGAYISDPFEEDGTLCEYIAIANEEGTQTCKLTAEDGENAKQIAKVCADKLLMLLCDYERMGNIDNEETVAEKQANGKLRDILAIAASGAVLLASISGFIAALIMR